MKKRPIIYLAITFVLVAVLSACSQAVSTPPPPASQVPTKAPVVANTPPPEVKATSTTAPTSVPEPAKAVIVEYDVPENAMPLLDASGSIKAFTYTINEAKDANPLLRLIVGGNKNSFDAKYPYQSHILITFGNAWISYGDAHEKLTSDGTIGNIYTEICDKPEGCKLGVLNYTPGHVQVTVVFGGTEVPAETLAWAVNFMLSPGSSNCGANGCKTVNVVDRNSFPTVGTFTQMVKPADVAGFLTAPKAPYVQVKLNYKGVPKDANVITDSKNVPVGQEYYLADKEASVSVPEAGFTVIFCGAKCTIDGKKVPAGTAKVFEGTKSDGSTPADLNRTLSISSSDPNMIRVVMIYGGDTAAQLAQLKAKYPDWTW